MPTPSLPPCLPPSLRPCLQGKSTLANWLLQDERCLTGPEPGLTRDAIKQRMWWEGQEVELVDTAGWIRRTRLSNYDESGECRAYVRVCMAWVVLCEARRAWTQAKADNAVRLCE
jgi:predicted GTPase